MRTAASPSLGALGGVIGLRLQRLRLMGGGLLSVAVVALIFAELMLYGGDSLEVSLLFATIELLGLGLLILFTPWVRSALSRRSRLQLPILLFLLTLVWCFAQVLPLPFALPESGWAHVPKRPIISIDSYASMAEAVKLAGLGAIAMVGVALGRNDDRAHWVWNTLGLFGGIYLAWAIAEHMATPAATRGLLKASLGGENSAGCVVAMLAVIAWTALLRAGVSLTHQSLSGDRLQKALVAAAPWGLLLFLSLGALSLTGSRGGAGAALLGLLAATAAMVVGERTNRRAVMVIMIATGAAMVCFVGLIIATGATGARLSRLDFVLANRGEILSIYAAKLADAPWTGFGLGTFRHFNALLVSPGGHEVLWDLGALHNVYLQWMLEAGWPGALFMFGTVAALILTALGGLRRRRFGRTWIVGATAVSVVVLAQGLIDFGLQSPAIASLWALTLGLGAGVSRPERTSKPSSID